MSKRPKHGKRRKKISCAKCRKQFRVRKYIAPPLTCKRIACRTWADEQRKMRESIARLSAPTANLMVGVDMAHQMSKSMAFAAAYGMPARRFGSLIQSSGQHLSKALKAKMDEVFPAEYGAKLKGVQMMTHDEITFEVEINEPVTGKVTV